MVCFFWIIPDHFISGSTTQNIRLLDPQGATLSAIKYTEGFLAQRAGTVGLLNFHPRRLMLAIGLTTSSSVSVFSLKPGDLKKQETV